jgi:hypothetical protein
MPIIKKFKNKLDGARPPKGRIVGMMNLLSVAERRKQEENLSVQYTFRVTELASTERAIVMQYLAVLLIMNAYRLSQSCHKYKR